MNDALTYSKSGLRLTEDFEGFRAEAYRDQGGVWTIAYGHTGPDVTVGLVVTQAQAEILLAHDVETAERFVKRVVKVALTQAQFDALVDFTFNAGVGNLLRSTLLKLVNAGRFDDAAAQFAKWDLVAGQHNKGLARRRLSEAEMFELQQAA
jgi:lysozyme